MKKKRELKPRLRFPEFRDAGGWKMKSLQDFLIDLPQYGVNASAVPYSCALPAYLRITDISEEGRYIAEKKVSVDILPSATNLLSEGDIVLARTGASVGKCYKYKKEDGPLVFAGYLIRISPNREKLDAVFLFYFLSTSFYWRWIKATSARSGQPGINGSEYSSMPIFYPGNSSENDLDEQRRIGLSLQSVDDLICSEANRLSAFQAYKKSLTQQLFPAEGETVPKLRFPEFRKAGKWKGKKIGDVLDEIERPLEMQNEAEYSLVTVKRRYGGVVFRERLEGRSIKVKSQFLVCKDDFLISKRQIVHNACGLVPEELAGSIVSNEYAVFLPREECDIHFFNYFVQQPVVGQSFLASSVGIVIEKMLFKTDVWLRNSFYFPSIEEQRKIAKTLTSLDNLITLHTQKLDLLKAHKKGLMQQLFPAHEEVAR